MTENNVPGLKNAIKKAGVTQGDLAKSMGVTVLTVSRWVRGEIEPSISTVKKIAGILGCSVQEILGLEPSAVGGCRITDVQDVEGKKIIMIEVPRWEEKKMMTLKEIKEKYAGGKMSELGLSFTPMSEEEAAKLIDRALPFKDAGSSFDGIIISTPDGEVYGRNLCDGRYDGSDGKEYERLYLVEVEPIEGSDEMEYFGVIHSFGVVGR